MSALTEKKAFWGYLAIGFFAMLGGIVMFVVVVPDRDRPADAAPKDMTMVFTEIYLAEANLHSAGYPFSPNLEEISVDQETCKKFNCSYRILDSGKDFEVRMSQGDRMWRIRSGKMIPTEIKEEK